jgi:WD40 repeat protein
MKSLSGFTGVLLALLCAAGAAFGAEARPSPHIYESKFQDNLADHWNDNRLRLTPNGKRRFFGAFTGKSSAILRLQALPAHQLVRVRFTLFLFRGQGGNSKGAPDFWSLSDASGSTLFRTSFEFPHPSQPSEPAPRSQSFPDESPVSHPAGTGAAELGTLGNGANRENDPDAAADMVYHLEAVFPHTDSELELRFSSEFMGGPPQRTWGLENVTVETVKDFVERSDIENQKLWDDLTGQNAMNSWNALWRLAEGGPRTAAFVAQKLGPQNAEERARRLVHDLTASDSLSRERASAMVDDLAPSDIFMLSAALGSSETPDSLRPKLQKMIEELTAESAAFTPRVARLLRILGTPEAKAMLAGLEAPSPAVPANSPVTLVWQRGHAIEENSRTKRCVFTPDGKQLLSISGDGLRAWDAASGKCERFESARNFSSLGISPDGATVAAGTRTGPIFLWTLPNWNMRQLLGDRGWIWSFAFTPDSKQLWSGASDGIREWDINTAQQLRVVAVPTVTRHLCFSPDGLTLASSQNSYGNQQGCVVIRDPATGDAMRQIGRLRGKPTSAAFSPDGKLLALTKDNRNTIIYSFETGQKVNQFDSPGPEGECVVFTPDGKYLCVGGGGGDGTSVNQRGLHLYRMADGAEVWRFTNVNAMCGAAFSPDGARLAAIDDEGRVYLWDMRPGLE